MRVALLTSVLVFAALGPSAAAGPTQAATFQLSVSISGKGRVTSSPAGIDCPGTCSAKFGSRTSVSLSQKADSGWNFDRWGGACSGSGGCAVTMDSNKDVSAVFEEPVQVPKPRYDLSVAVVGGGTVVSDLGGIACPGACVANYEEGTHVVLAPVAGANAVFTGWSGACSGTSICTVTMDGAKSATATFTDRRTPPAQARPSPDTTTPDRAPLGTYELDLPFMCTPAGGLWLDQVYRDTLKRPADQAALDVLGALLAGGAPRTDVALLVLQSIEARISYVQALYAAHLKRQPNGQELAAKLDLLLATRDETLQAQILGSSEYFTNRGGGTNDGFVDALYQDLLGRTPTSAERAGAVNLLTHGTNSEELATAVLKSKEARTRLVQGYFQAFLGRPAGQAELDAFLARYDQNATNEAIQAAILGSQEYVDKSTGFEAAVDWGDGSTSPGTVQQNGGRCVVVGTHRYGSEGNKRISVEVTSPDGTDATFTRLLLVTPPPPPPPGKINVRPAGKVFVKKNGTFVPLTGFEQLPVGTEIDARKGKVTITAHDGSTGQFYEGIFRIGQEKVGRLTFTTIILTGGNFRVCTTKKGRKLSSAAKGKPPKSVRHVWGNAKGHFRTKGKYASATIRGTLWLTDDQCPGTRVTVRRGIVDVLDFVKRTHVLVAQGRTYLATPKK